MVIEGGAFVCFIHEFETGSVKKWDKHLSEIYHALEVRQQCEKCGQWNSETIPHPERFVELSHMGKDQLKKEIGREKVILLKCPKCEDKSNNEI